jgi:WD40 repeat protein
MRCHPVLQAAIVLSLLLSACGSAQPTATPSAPDVQLKKAASLDVPDSFINTVVFSPDGGTLFTADRNGEVLRWERDTWAKTILAPARSTRAEDDAASVYFWGTMALSPDGRVLATAYGDSGEVTALDPAGQELYRFSLGARVYSVAISPDGRYLAVAGLKKSVLVVDPVTGRQIADLQSEGEETYILAFSPDSRTLLASYRLPEKVLTLWDTATWGATQTLSPPLEPNNGHHGVVFTPDGRQLVIASTEPVEIKFLDPATGQFVRELPQHTRAPYQLAFSPDGGLLASAADDGTMRLFDLRTGANVKTVSVLRQELGAVAFSPDGALVAFSVWGQGVQVYAVTRK